MHGIFLVFCLSTSHSAFATTSRPRRPVLAGTTRRPYQAPRATFPGEMPSYGTVSTVTMKATTWRGDGVKDQLNSPSCLPSATFSQDCHSAISSAYMGYFSVRSLDLAFRHTDTSRPRRPVLAGATAAPFSGTACDVSRRDAVVRVSTFPFSRQHSLFGLVFSLTLGEASTIRLLCVATASLRIAV